MSQTTKIKKEAKVKMFSSRFKGIMFHLIWYWSNCISLQSMKLYVNSSHCLNLFCKYVIGDKEASWLITLHLYLLLTCIPGTHLHNICIVPAMDYKPLIQEGNIVWWVYWDICDWRLWMEGERHSLSSVKTENEYLGSLKTSLSTLKLFWDLEPQ